MFTYTTCADCGGLLHITEDTQIVHPGCAEPKPSKLDRLVADYLDAIENGLEELEGELWAQIKAIETAPPRLAESARIYASWGWPVFPLIPLARAHEIAEETGDPFDKIAKRPATKKGVLDATTAQQTIFHWWARTPDAGIGLATGHLFDVIDVDPRHGGTESWAAALEDGKLPDRHAVVATAGGGYHHYVKPTGGPNRANVRPGIDIRGKGGYVVAPPSWLGDHRRWSWIVKPSPEIRA